MTPHGHARSVEDRRQQRRGRRLAVRAGDTHGGQCPTRVTGHLGCDRSEPETGVVDDDLGHVDVFERMIDEKCRGPGIHGIGSERMAVEVITAKTGVQGSGRDLARVVDDGPDRCSLVDDRSQLAQAGEVRRRGHR